MMQFKEGLYFYGRHFEKLLLLSLTVLLPFLLLHAFISNYIYILTLPYGTSVIGDLWNGFFTLLFLVVAQLPFIQYVFSYIQDDDYPIKKAYHSFIKYGLSSYLFALVYCFAVILGFSLFIIPGALLLIFFYLTPYIMVVEEKSAIKALRSTVRMAKKRFFSIAGIVLLFSLLEMIIGFGSMIGIASVTSNYLAIMLSQILLNMIIFPLMVVIVTFYVDKWKNATI